MSKVIDLTNVGYLISKMKAAFWPKSDVVTIGLDDSPTANSTNLVKSGGVKSYVDSAIPTVPVISTDISTDATSDTKTSSPKAVKTYVDNSIPTISTDIAADKNNNTKAASPNAVYAEIHPTVQTTSPTGGFLPNILYDLGTLTGTITFSIASPSDANIINHYYWTFETGTTAPTITWPTGITWYKGSAPTINSSKHYEISILDGMAVSLEI